MQQLRLSTKNICCKFATTTLEHKIHLLQICNNGPLTGDPPIYLGVGGTDQPSQILLETPLIDVTIHQDN